ncbi:MAG: hypothetical protein LBT55_03670 [Clostridiaceae bacterium]|nr:hypothetical protein [Clostridiaceae bacterium]
MIDKYRPDVPERSAIYDSVEFNEGAERPTIKGHKFPQWIYSICLSSDKERGAFLSGILTAVFCTFLIDLANTAYLQGAVFYIKAFMLVSSFICAITQFIHYRFCKSIQDAELKKDDQINANIYFETFCKMLGVEFVNQHSFKNQEDARDKCTRCIRKKKVNYIISIATACLTVILLFVQWLLINFFVK